jgi:hypothetical protein
VTVRSDWKFALLILFGIPMAGMTLALAIPILCGPEDGRAEAADTPPTGAQAKAARFKTETIRGRVVWLAEAHKRLFGATSVPEAQERGLALETADGRLVPLLEDERGRAFRVDKRLRDINVELLVRRYEASPVVQILGVHQVKSDGRHEVDYWCDVCAIAMYELKPCECCQAEPRLRLRRADDSKSK